MHTIREAKAPGCVPSGQTHSRVDLTGLLEGFNDIINKVLHVVPRLQQGLYKYQLLGIANIYRLRWASNTVLSICGPAESHACPKGSIHVSMGGNQAQRCEVQSQQRAGRPRSLPSKARMGRLSHQCYFQHREGTLNSLGKGTVPSFPTPMD